MPLDTMSIVNLWEVCLFGIFFIYIFYAVRRFGWKAAPIFATSFIAGWLMEWHIAPGHYYYPNYMIYLPGQIPLVIPLMWFAVVLLGLTIAFRFNILYGVLGASSLDFILEPLAYYFGFWIWLPTNPLNQITYFEAPLGNAIGWFIFVAIFVTTWQKILKQSVRFSSGKDYSPS